jgi:ribosomal-protein-alanine N-acetyltransferase
MNKLFRILSTDRLTLRPISLDDWEAILTIRSNPTINQYLDRMPCRSKDDAIEFIQQVQKNIAQNTSFYWAVTLTECKTVVGTICLFAFTDHRSSGEIGYELLPSYHGKGIMVEAASAVIDYAQVMLKIPKILAFTHEENVASIALLSKLNFIDTKTSDPDDEKMKCYAKVLNTCVT